MNTEITYHVFELNQKIKEVVETSFPESIWVQGEIAGFDRQSKQKNIFFQLQEKDTNHNRLLATIDCLLPDSAKPQLRRRLINSGVAKKISQGMDGLSVRLKARVSVYAPGGKYSLIIEDIDPSFTLGQLEQSRQEIIKRLTKAGLIDKNRKETQLPIVIQKIGLITKEGSQAYFDFLKKLESSHLSFSVSFYQATMQGRQVETDILNALNYFSHHQKEVEVIAIVRGGGAKSDLSWFDNQKIAEAIANFPKPVLTGIGHKTDTSIADLVAYFAAPTPSSLADFLTSHNEEYLQLLERLQKEIKLHLNNNLRFHNQKIENFRLAIQEAVRKNCQVISQSLYFFQEQINQNSYQYLRRQQENLEGIKNKISNRIQEIITQSENKIERIKENINLLDPINIMKRGFSLTLINGKIVKSLQGVKIGEEMLTQLYQGKIKSSIKDVQKRKPNLK